MKSIEVQGKRVRVRTINNEKTMTQQQFKEQCDVNHIVAKYKKTGELTHVARTNGVYADLSKITDYHTMVNQIQEAQNAFMTLPASVRLRFQNDPGALLAFMQDPKNYEEGVKLGLFERRAANINNDDLNDDDKRAANNQKASKTKPSDKTSSTPPKEE